MTRRATRFLGQSAQFTNFHLGLMLIIIALSGSAFAAGPVGPESRSPQPGAAVIQFTDVSSEAGISEEIFSSTTFHSLGVVWIDIDDDSWPDLFVTNGFGRKPALYHNKRNGTFTNRSDLLPELPDVDMTGAIFADYDNDGDSDIYIYTDNEQFDGGGFNEPDGPPNILLQNQSANNGRQMIVGEPLFIDVAAAAGVDDLADPPFGDYPGYRAKTAGWLDYDRDGCVDLFVGHMVLNDEGSAANRDRFFRNRCDGTFEDVTSQVGLYPTDAPEDDTYRPTLAFIGGHLSADLWPDMYVVHVSTGAPDMHIPVGHHDRIFGNNQAGGFKEVSFPGVGDDAQAGMGIDLADIDLDGDFDVYISDNFTHTNELETPPPFGNPLYLNDSGLQENSADVAGLEAGSSWPVIFMDIDRDGYEDLFVGTTDIYSGLSYWYLNNQDLTFTDVSGQADCVTPGEVRGAAKADFDHDGDLDIAVVSQDTALQIFRNDSTSVGNWLAIDLQATVSNRDAIGANVLVKAGGLNLRRSIHGGSSAHSQNSLRLYFGLGEATVADRIVIQWPSGIVQSQLNIAANQTLTAVESAISGDF